MYEMIKFDQLLICNESTTEIEQITQKVCWNEKR